MTGDRLTASHHWRHTSEEEGIDRNFAVFLSFIDQLFGALSRR